MPLKMDANLHPLVALQGVDVDIAGTRVLRGIDWMLEAGTSWGIVGPNGSGKSTLLALVAGHVWPAPGRGRRRYDFGDGVQTDAVEARRRIALVGAELQNRYTGYGWRFTAEAVVLSGIFRTDIPRRRATGAEAARARSLLQEAGLAHVAARPFLELSRGEQRRVLIARARAFAPQVLLLDEPAAGLDGAARAALDASITRSALATTLVCAAHEIGDLPSAVTRVLHLDGGCIARRGRRVAGGGGRGIAAEAAPTSSGGAVAAEAAPTASGDAVVGEAGAIAGTGAAVGEAGVVTGGALVEVEHADVWLGGRRILADVCWRLAPGEHWLVTGENGAGKSAFLRLLHGQLRPARGGTVRWPALGNARNVWRLRRQIGYISAELQAEYRYAASVRECVASGFDSSFGLTRPLTADEQSRVAALLERFALTPLASRPPAALSYGQMHSVLLARTLVNRPRVLLLDEPWEGLDAATCALVRAQLSHAIADGAQLVLASHVGAMGVSVTHEATIAAGRLEMRAARALNDGDEYALLPENSASAPRRERGCRPR